MKNKQIYILLAIVVVILGVGIIVIGNKGKSTTANNSPRSTNTSGMMVENNSIAVGSQGETNTLDASMMVLTDPSYVVVHEDNNGQPGKIIGVSKLVGPGMVHGVSVPLSRNAIKGEKLYAMLHKDNGDKTYSGTDQPVVSKSGEPILMIVTVGTDSSTPGEMSM